MRLAPAPSAFANDPAEAIRLAGESSRTTHAALECIDACRYFAGLLLAAINGLAKDELLRNAYEPAARSFAEMPLAEKVQAIAKGSFREKQPPEIRGSGYVIHTLEAARGPSIRPTAFAHGALAVVNLGEDADTTGAVFGQIAGAYYGVDGIPAEWREKLRDARSNRPAGTRVVRAGIPQRAGSVSDRSETSSRRSGSRLASPLLPLSHFDRGRKDETGRQGRAFLDRHFPLLHPDAVLQLERDGRE